MDKLETLKYYFGHNAFRPGQEQLVDALLSGHDALGVMPTGAGKSLCYQIPALMVQGITLVISPLISLMKDQVAALKSAGVPAAYLNSSLTAAQLDLATERARQGAYRIIYVAPERLETASFRAFARSAPIRIIAVDEAHCVSQWGQDFRPNYLKIADFIASLPCRPAVGAFTATATDRVRSDIIRLLQLQNPVYAATGFDRPNLYFEVAQPKSKYEALRTVLRQKRGESGIVYCATRKTVEEVTDKLIADGYAAGRYHAGLSDAERERNQEDFQYDRVQVMVATNAFGMGIDKSNVRFVIHYNMPRSMEAYYQEAGRAGRDGEAAECVLLYSGQDIITGKWMLAHAEPNPELSPQEQATVRRQDLQRLYQMVDYCTKSTCLRASILRYFGQTAQEKCGACSRCTGGHYPLLNGLTRAEGSRAPRPMPRGTQVSAFEDGEALMPLKPGVRLGHNDAPAQETAQEDTLFERLRACRMELSRQLRVPPYVVASDKTLADMARRCPRSLNEMLEVYGMGTAKVGKYGPAFLQTLLGWKATQGGTPLRKQATQAKPSKKRAAPAWPQEEQDRLRRGYLAGVSTAQLAAMFGQSESAVIRQLQKMHLMFSTANVERYGVAAYEENDEDEP